MASDQVPGAPRPTGGGPPRKGPPPPPARWVLLRAGAPPFRLIPEKVLVIGRQDGCGLVVPSQRVSRRHAEIAWEEGAPVLRDCGSQNGTTVNGRRVTEPHRLEDGDEIGVGPFLCTFRDTRRPRAAGPQLDDLTRPMAADTMAGSLSQLSLFELLQTLEFNHKTGTLEVFGSDGEGQVVVREGRPVFARAEGQEGAEAVLRLLRCRAGQFSFSAELAAHTPNLSGTITSLLLEAGRRLDEQGQDGG